MEKHACRKYGHNSLQLLQLLVLKGLGVLAEAQGVKGAARVHALLHILVVIAQAFSNGHGQELLHGTQRPKAHSDSQASGALPNAASMTSATLHEQDQNTHILTTKPNSTEWIT